jgi:hypothetical protein
MAEGPPQQPIVYRRTDRLVVGVHPKGGVGNQHSVEVITIEEYDKLLRTDPAYVTTDGHIVSSPPATKPA